ncbi:hypothetical protein CK203_111341 [Vitis vinifera]|uniref:Uncharacterized protein n=1 Tax=Vitis vinifera TaxID=29760 RepID=A0A438CRX1_VITVI|nr:hypothetical protein CK203_111341 [Vitis vinifera]
MVRGWPLLARKLRSLGVKLVVLPLWLLKLALPWEVWREEGWGWVFQSFEGRLWGWPLEGDLEWVEGVLNKRVGFRPVIKMPGWTSCGIRLEKWDVGI